MTMATRLSREAERDVAEIVRLDLAGKFGSAISCDTVRIIPGEDAFGEPYHHIEVVYLGDSSLLDPGWLNGFGMRNESKLAKWGISITTESYIEKAEDSAVLG